MSKMRGNYDHIFYKSHKTYSDLADLASFGENFLLITLKSPQNGSFSTQLFQYLYMTLRSVAIFKKPQYIVVSLICFQENLPETYTHNSSPILSLFYGPIRYF